MRLRLRLRRERAQLRGRDDSAMGRGWPNSICPVPPPRIRPPVVRSFLLLPVASRCVPWLPVASHYFPLRFSVKHGKLCVGPPVLVIVPLMLLSQVHTTEHSASFDDTSNAKSTRGETLRPTASEITYFL